MPKQLCVSFALALAECVVAQPSLAETSLRPPLILVAGGCGPAYHPNPLGDCVPNQRFIRLPPPCPRGYHRDPDPARPICYPNL